MPCERPSEAGLSRPFGGRSATRNTRFQVGRQVRGLLLLVLPLLRSQSIMSDTTAASTAAKQEEPTIAPQTADIPAESAQAGGAVPEKDHESAAAAAEEEADDMPPRQRLDEADRLMALKQWEVAADQYAQVLDGLREEFPDEHSPQLAPILHRYGRSLLEHAIATSGALGGGGGGGAGQAEAPMPVKKAKAKSGGGEASSSKPADPRFSFSGDADDDDEEEEEGDAQPQEEEEDDLSVAFAVLDLARIIYQKLLDADTASDLTTIQGQIWAPVRVKNELAEVLNDLGDVGLESENFQQASADYEASLQLLSPLLHPHSRRLADAYLRLGLALEFHPEQERQAEAGKYVQSAANTLRTRLEALKSRRTIVQRGSSEEARKQAAAAQLREEKAREESVAAAADEGREAAEAAAEGSAGKGKGKAIAAIPIERDDVAEMDEPRVERELKDVEEMITDLEAKLADDGANAANANANGAGSSSSSSGAPLPDAAKQALQQAINEAFLGASTNALHQPHVADGPVNDLSGMVRKKKRPVEGAEEGKGKGKESDIGEGSGSGSKKAKVEDEGNDS